MRMENLTTWHHMLYMDTLFWRWICRFLRNRCSPKPEWHWKVGQHRRLLALEQELTLSSGIWWQIGWPGSPLQQLQLCWSNSIAMLDRLKCWTLLDKTLSGQHQNSVCIGALFSEIPIWTELQKPEHKTTRCYWIHWTVTTLLKSYNWFSKHARIRQICFFLTWLWHSTRPCFDKPNLLWAFGWSWHHILYVTPALPLML